MSARPSRSYPWPVEGANVEDSEEASPSQMSMLPEYVPEYVSLETCSVCEATTGEDNSMALQSPHEAAFQAMDTAINEFSDNAIGVPDEVNQFWRGTFLENPSMTIEETIPEMSPAMQYPNEAVFQAMDTEMNEASDNAIGVSDGTNQFWRGTFLENPSTTIEQTVPENNAIGVPDEVNQFWRGTFLENPPMTIEERIPEMSPAMRSPSEAASDASSMTMNNSIDAEVTTTNSTFERVWELMERRRQQRRERVVAGIAEEDWNLDRLAEVFPTRFTDEQWVQLMTEFSAEECQRLFYVLELAYKRAIDSGGQTASVP
ncbi:hypothetical protein E4U13_002848 [Claviceps humidiphila]|uniref:Uncharacterized protein n=1 Tax=Claviceps humidiphila TaxID=1294629 RepID=A0A9P7U160_9HYPO|nr:hypothetical protein E4U13_002848 [Claviceps humidiphila]